MPKITDNKWFGTPIFKLTVRGILAALSVLVVFFIALPNIYWYLRTFVYVNEASPRGKHNVILAKLV